ncbi:MAG: hypothetical protein GX410_04895, partial [Elusimicrobia bacterium]|nr:hypothetical protein [Elusimicrobiota bacterium]
NIASQEGWNAAVPAAAYLALANQYLKMQDYDKAVKILEKNPKYTWEEDYWRSYIKCKLAVDQIRQINLADVPEALKLEMMEDMFKRGYSAEVNEYLLDEPRYKWKPEYYFYFIAITAQNKGVDDALEICRQFMEQVKPDKGSSKAYYIIGVLCEFMSRPEKAVAIYQGLADAGAACMDSDARLAALKVSHRPAPSAEEILAQVMPAGYQFRKK